MFQYAKNRFVNPKKIVSVSIYSKQSKDVDESGNYPVVHRVAIDLDVKEVTKSVVYSDAYATEQEAAKFLSTIPVSED